MWNPFQGEVIAGPFSFVRLLPSAHWSVTVFILLSGFCLALPLVQGKPLVMKEYFIRRFIRIVPPYWITLAISVALILTLLHDETGTIWDLSRSVDAKGLISHAFLLHNAVDQSITINYPLWTVAVEWQIYFFLPLFWAGWRWIGPLKTTCIVMALGWGGGHFLRHTRFDGLVLHFYGIFALGMLMAGWTFGSKVPGWIQRHIRLIALAGAFCLLLVAIISACLSEYDRTRYIKWTDIPVATGAAFLILAAAGGGAAWFRAFFSTRVLTWVGGFSYTLYLLHAPLLQLGYLALRTLTTDRNVLFLLLTFIVIPLIVAASFALSLVIERPFLRMIKNRNAMANPRAT